MSKVVWSLKTQWIRRGIQAAVVGLVGFIGYQHQYGTGFSPLDAYCPLGGVETLYSWVATGKMLSKTGFSNFILLGALILMTLLAGGVFCGWLCPVGTVQDWIYALRKKVIKKPFKIPPKVDRVLRYLRYVVLASILILTIRGATLWFIDYDPFKAFFAFELDKSTTYYVIGFMVIFSLLIERFWCKYLCPLGAILSPLAQLGLLKIKKTEKCVQCNLCLSKCSMGLHEIGASGCNNCLECSTSCPSSKATAVTFIWNKKPKTKIILPVLGILVGILVVLGSMGAGLWETRTAMSKVALPASAQTTQSNYPPVEGITGMTLLDEVAKTYELTPVQILEKAGLNPSENPHQPIRDITRKVGSEVEVIRDAVSQLITTK